ncbi:hypothetical protein [Paenibacillus rigui]|uniref:hypothetical protein n=1 Tax=Paenibacillus rigui TaxID=554312 RepID=UPI00117C3960|nr:hypothetical protein [Paenibacillus rigui]
MYLRSLLNDAFLTWWPIIFVLLGLEILGYLVFAKKESSVLYYDMLSLFFVGVLCIGCLGFAMLTSVGLMGEVRSMLGSIEKTKDLPAIKEALGEGVKKVVVQSADGAIKVDKSTDRSIQVFGTYRERVKAGVEEQVLQKEQVISVHSAGDTMYVQIKRLPEERGLDSFYPRMNVTVVLPQEVQVELRDADNQVIS